MKNKKSSQSHHLEKLRKLVKDKKPTKNVVDEFIAERRKEAKKE